MDIGHLIHFSIDDVINNFRWIYLNRPQSVFEVPFFKKLKEWYIKYGISCDLYVYEIGDGFQLSDLQDQYWEEFRQTASWLKFGWHRRKAGELTDDIETEIASLIRIKSLVCSKISQEAWSDTVRLHKWKGDKKLLQCLREHGIKNLLTSYDGTLSYDLREEDQLLLNNEGVIYKEPFSYIKTDIRLDYLSSELDVNNTVDFLEDYFGRHKKKGNIIAFCHEWAFEDTKIFLQLLWDRLEYANTILYPNAAVVVGDWLYFSACYDNHLYRLNLLNKSIEEVCYVPLCRRTISPFESLHYYEGCIWMIPWMGDAIYVYSIANKYIEKYHLPAVGTSGESYRNFRSHIVRDKYLWLMPSKCKGIIRIDMGQKSYVEYNNWPEGTEFNETSQHYFKMMCMYDEYIYIFNDGCNKSIRLHIDTGEMSEWKLGKDRWFGIMLDQKLFVSPVRPRDNLKEIFINDYHKEKEEILPEKIWLEAKYYSYWYPTNIKEYIFFLPNEANGIIMKNIYTEEVKVIDINVDNRNRRLGGENNYSVYQIVSYKDKHVVIPYRGNKVIILNECGDIEEELEIAIQLRYTKNQRNIDLINVPQYEKQWGYTIKEYIQDIKKVINRDLKIEMNHKKETIGELIYRKINFYL